MVVADGSTVLDGEVAGEGLEAAFARTGNFGACEANLRLGGEDVFLASGGIGGLDDDFLYVGVGGLVGLIVAGDEANHEESEDGCFHWSVGQELRIVVKVLIARKLLSKTTWLSVPLCQIFLAIVFSEPIVSTVVGK